MHIYIYGNFNNGSRPYQTTEMSPNSKQRQDIISLLLPLFKKKKKKSNPVTSYFGWSPSKSILSCRTLRNEGKKKSESSYRPLIPGVSWQITLGFSTDVNYCKPCPNGLRYNLTSPSLQHFFYASLVHFPCQGQRSE